MAQVNHSASSSRTTSPPHTPSRSRSNSIMKGLVESPTLQQLHQQQQTDIHPHTQLKRITTNDSLLPRLPNLHGHGQAHHHEDSPITTQTNHQLSDAQLSNKPEHYDLQNPIGYGSSAVVYGAIYKPTHRKVAIKVIDLDMFERNQIDELRRETALMALSKHPNVLRVYGSFVSGSKLYIITPYLSGGSCLDIMKTSYPDGFDEISIATILKQALEGLIYLHKNGHIHRDVKAGNLLMDEHGVVQLADFGVSSSLTENNEVRKTFVGTPCWMAPEVMEQAGYDFKADIWSFGITAIELATGHAPFAKYAPMKVLMMTLSQDPPSLSRENAKHKFSKMIKEMIDTCLQKDPKKRPSAEKLLQHPFFRQAKKKDFLVKAILNRIPALDQRPHKKVPQKQTAIESTDQWDFDTFSDDDSTSKQSTTPTTPLNNKKHISFGEAVVKPPSNPKATSLSPTIESPDERSPSDNQVSPDLAIPTPQRKSRFVVGENPPDQQHNTAQSQRSVSSVHEQQPIPHVSTTMYHSSEKDGVGLGISRSTSTTTSSGQEVKKGRFSVNQTLQRTASVSSPLLEPGQTDDGQEFKSTPVARIGSNDSLRKSRFAVHHSPVTTGDKPPPSTSSSSVESQPSSRKPSVGSCSGKVSRFQVAKEDSMASTKDDYHDTTPAMEGRKKGRFQLSNMGGGGDLKLEPKDGGSGGGYLESPQSSVSSSYSPNSSFSRGQSTRLMDMSSFHSQMDHLYKQADAQKVLIHEMMIGLSLGVNRAPAHESRPRSGTLTHELSHTMDYLQHLLMLSGREKEQLQRENEHLRRELDRVRRKGQASSSLSQRSGVVDPLPPSTLDYFTPPRPHTTSPTAMTPLDSENLRSPSLTVHASSTADKPSALPTPSTSYSSIAP